MEPSSILALSLASSDEPYAAYEADDLTIKMESSSILIKCRAYHERRFRMLREQLGESNEQFIRSMMRCAVWNASGGKSGATFYKSHDSRFVIKQVEPHTLYASFSKTKFVKFRFGNITP